MRTRRSSRPSVRWRTVSIISSSAMERNSHSPMRSMLRICAGVMSIALSSTTSTSKISRSSWHLRTKSAHTTTAVAISSAFESRWLLLSGFIRLSVELMITPSEFHYATFVVHQQRQVGLGVVLAEGHHDILGRVAHRGNQRNQRGGSALPGCLQNAQSRHRAQD